jgi:hypothetical protein
MTALETRLERLEREFAPDLDDPLGLNGLTWDQRSVRYWQLCRQMLASPEVATIPTADRAVLGREVAEIGAEIRECAASVVSYPDHWRSVAEEWAARCTGLAYTPPIATSGSCLPPGDDAEAAEAEMRWRAETRARPRTWRAWSK